MPENYKFPFPDDLLPPEQKVTKEYGLSSARAIYEMQQRGYAYLGFNPRLWYPVMDLYAEGRQPETQYMSVYRGLGTFVSPQNPTSQSASSIVSGEDDFFRKGLQNINFQIVSILPKLMSIMSSVLNEADQMIDIESNAKEALEKKVYEKWKLFAGATIVNGLRKSAGLPERKYSWYPRNEQELELYEKYHGFKLAFETGLLHVIKDVFHISHWDDIWEQFKRSVLKTGWACYKIDTNSQGAVVIKYIEPARYVTSYMKKQKLDEPPFAGFIEYVPIVDIIPALRAQGLNDEQIAGIARANADINDYADLEYCFTQRDPATQRYLWYDWYVQVMNFEVRSNDRIRFRKYTKKDGTHRYVAEKAKPKTGEDGVTTFDYFSNTNRDGTVNSEKIDVQDKQTVYEGRWVVNSEVMLSYDRQVNVLKNSDGTACLSYGHIHVEGVPMVERLQPGADQFMMSWIKLQAAVLNARPDGFFIDIGVLSNMDFGFGKMDGPKLLKILRETGNLFGLTTDIMIRNRINISQAIKELKGGLGEQAAQWWVQMHNIADLMRNVSGITSAMEAGSDKKPELVGLMEGEMIATSNALYDVKRGLISLKQRIAEKAVNKARLLMEFNPPSTDYYEGVIGDRYVKEILLYRTLTLNQIGVILRAAPTKERKMAITQALQMALTPGKSGKPQISIDDYLMVENSLEEGYIQNAAWLLSVSMARTREQEAMQSAADQEANAQVQIQSAQAAEKAAQETIALAQTMKTEGNLKEIALKGELESRLSAQKSAEKRAELILQASLEPETVETTTQ